jgi:hypothetical protein
MVHQLFLARPLSNRLEALGSFPDRKAADGLEPRFMARLDRSGRSAFLPEGDR